MKSEETPLRVELAKSILTATPSDIVAYKKFLGSLVPASQAPLHCVRCHESYVEYENNSRSCKILHDNWEYLGDDASEDYLCSDLESCDSEGEPQPLVRYLCCGQRMREDQADYNREMCIQEKHTTDPTKVDYFVDPDAGPKKKKKKVEYSLDYYSRYKNKNPLVVTCKEKKCSRE
ncbi:hypothetical protein FRC08_005700 [Ceratobasidium sp. 394]|nr:hypothetical protein FRC08_005700 [Ceratobasidium sp. 394]KAG9076323.1 hypothetical protein FS749_011919 [Ceratobasidium sp. UAMH 11750]